MTWRLGGIIAGAAIFAVLTVPVTILVGLPAQGIGAEAVAEGNVLIGAILVAAAALLVRPPTRPVAVGFFGALLVASAAAGGLWGRVWWQPVDRLVGRATAPLRLKIRGARQMRAWTAAFRERSLDVDAAIGRMLELQSGCIREALARHSAGGVSTAEAVTAPEDCQHFRRDALEIAQAWPQRFDLPDDTGWRWTLSPSSVPSRFGGPGFLLTVRPDPLLERDGPIIELDGQNVLRARAAPSAPSYIVKTPIPALRRLRDCLVVVGRELPGGAVWYYFPESDLRRACRDIMVTVSGSPAPVVS